MQQLVQTYGAVTVTMHNYIAQTICLTPFDDYNSKHWSKHLDCVRIANTQQPIAFAELPIATV